MTDCAASLRELAEPSLRGDRVKAAVDRAAKLAGLSYWRAFDIWYGKARRIEQFEADQIADAVRKKTEEATRNELHDLRTRLLRLESILVSTDPEFHRPSIDFARGQIRQMGGGNGAGNRALARTTKR